MKFTLSLLLLLGITTTAIASSSVAVVTVKPNVANLRAEPTMKSSVVLKFPKGHKFVNVEMLDNGWTKIPFNDHPPAFIRSDLLQVVQKDHEQVKESPTRKSYEPSGGGMSYSFGQTWHDAQESRWR